MHVCFFFKQKTAYEMRISDWSSDVCSSDLLIATPEIEDVSVFPMAMPMLAGPGSIASVMLLVAQNNGLDRAVVIFGALLLVLLITLAALLAAGPLMRLIGNKG